jgi:ATP-dependent DNA ligase
MSQPKRTTVFPTLYNLSKDGKTKEWKISVEEFDAFSKIITSFGYIGGKTIITSRMVNSGKNTGKINQTTHFTQAVADATSKWKKKKDNEHYLENIDLKQEDRQQIDIPVPMLAQDYTKHRHKICFPCSIQPKLDGYRCLHTVGTGILWSRQGKQFLNCSHITEDLLKIEGDFAGVTLDGELYNHTGKFEDFGVLRKKTLRGEDFSKIKSIRYCIYDIVDESLPFTQRLEILKCLEKFIADHQLHSLTVVDTYSADSQSDVQIYHQKIVELGYEGTIIRNNSGKYIQKYRSYDLQKYKDFKDEEFPIVGFEREQGDLIVFVCKTKEGREFSVQCKGTREDRHQVYLDTLKSPQKYLGKLLWVQFFEYTADNIPRFPKSYRAVKDSIREITF